jgi:uncharacterized protein YegL
MKNTFKNHVYIVFDRSGSMSHLIDSAVKIFNKQIDFLRENSLLFEQETRVSFYSFNNSVDCVVSDVDVARPVKLDEMRASGGTALIDATMQAIADAKSQPQKYGDHAFYIYIITDGEENSSQRMNLASFKSTVQSLPNNFTIAAFVPDNNSKTILSNFGIPLGNIDKWDATEKGIEEVGQKFSAITRNMYTSRTRGVRSSQTIFSDLKDINKDNVTSVLSEIPKAQFKIVINEDVQAVEIRGFVEDKAGMVYKTGNAFYELVKNEHVQPQKLIAIQNKKTGKVYSGDNARQLLNLPNQEVKIVPGDFGEWNVYVQSTSVNRKIIPKQRVLVFK